MPICLYPRVCMGRYMPVEDVLVLRVLVPRSQRSVCSGMSPGLPFAVPVLFGYIRPGMGCGVVLCCVLLRWLGEPLGIWVPRLRLCIQNPGTFSGFCLVVPAWGQKLVNYKVSAPPGPQRRHGQGRKMLALNLLGLILATSGAKAGKQSN